ncbi:hypothetical protein Tco_0652264 [Tanacetum coccineum]|uniref:Integrase, catalytic region, zinc finger, CCHC-type, peptidase aspartic, catalytic n=1 Tax=Tanacetum coccineum TaxID=301880 RepID=A0ABQ4WXB2_9ASTR
MLDMTDFASWQQRIRLYCRGKENGVNILKSIDEGPFQMRTFRETLTEGDEDALHLGPERPRVYSDLSPKDKDRYNADIRHKGENIHDYYVRFAKLINDMRNIKMTMSRMQLNSKYRNGHEAHANENKMMLDRFTQHTVDPLALMTNVAPQQYNSQSSTNLSSTYVPPHFADNSQLDSGLSPTDNLIENLANTLALLTQSYKTYLPQTNNQLRTSSNPRNKPHFKMTGLWFRVFKVNRIEDRVIMHGVQDLALNVDNVFQADDCDAFDSDVDEAPTAQTMFMANLSSADPIYDEADSLYDSDILFEVHNHDHYQDAVCEHHEEHEMHDDVQPNYVVDSHADYTSNSNMIPYDQYVKDNAVPDSVSKTTQNIVVDNSLTVELETYKEQVELYERRVRFDITEREKKIDEQLRIVITDRNIKEEKLKKELHSVKLQLASTINHNKSMVEEVTSLKKDFKHKENKYLE